MILLAETISDAGQNSTDLQGESTHPPVNLTEIYELYCPLKTLLDQQLWAEYLKEMERSGEPSPAKMPPPPMWRKVSRPQLEYFRSNPTEQIRFPKN